MYHICMGICYWYWTRGLSPAERVAKAKKELALAFVELKHEFKDEPETRLMIDTFKGMEDILEEL